MNKHMRNEKIICEVLLPPEVAATFGDMSADTDFRICRIGKVTAVHRRYCIFRFGIEMRLSDYSELLAHKRRTADADKALLTETEYIGLEISRHIQPDKEALYGILYFSHACERVKRRKDRAAYVALLKRLALEKERDRPRSAQVTLNLGYFTLH